MPDSPLAITLTVPPGPQAVGAFVPVTVAVRNASDRPVWVVGVLDGSEAGFRCPRYTPEIVGPRPLPPVEGMPWCGMVAPLRPVDFRELRPGESFDPTTAAGFEAYFPLVAFNNFYPPYPGRYELRLTLSTESAREEDWLGLTDYPQKQAARALLAKVPRLTVPSNTAVVEVR